MLREPSARAGAPQYCGAAGDASKVAAAKTNAAASGVTCGKISKT
jgi:hypothetical protein